MPLDFNLTPEREEQANAIMETAHAAATLIRDRLKDQKGAFACYLTAVAAVIAIFLACLPKEREAEGAFRLIKKALEGVPLMRGLLEDKP